MNFAVHHKEIGADGRAKLNIKAGIVPAKVFAHKKGFITAVSSTVIQDVDNPDQAYAQDFRETIHIGLADRLPKNGYVYFEFQHE